MSLLDLLRKLQPVLVGKKMGRRNPKSVSDLTVIIPMCWETRYKLRSGGQGLVGAQPGSQGPHMTLPPCCLLAAFMTPGRGCFPFGPKFTPSVPLGH